MSAAEFHVMVVHVPVVGVFFTLFVVVAALRWRDDRLMRLGLVMFVVCALGAGLAYASGPPTYEKLSPQMNETTRGLAESHAGVARGAFFGSLLGGLLALQLLIRAAGGEVLPRWTGPVFLIVLLVLSVSFVWTAHLGGMIRHSEAAGAVVLSSFEQAVFKPYSP